MKIKSGFNLRQIGDEYIIVASGAENVDFTHVISLNESAARLWKEVDGKEFTERDLAKLLLDWYEIDEETARKDSETLAKDWLDAGIVGDNTPKQG
ncbi:PqqD family protein [Bacteroides sp. 214]|uniref:PqqD family protein n=1 Tax=Bacteroides sp. 214 TaxID=2302935 RepID=UPI0013D37658|nr:PqqD family protein [Bacteroides sp. 214]NDW12632.1 PqqD family protein [Bacteroides sp. 214]